MEIARLWFSEFERLDDSRLAHRRRFKLHRSRRLGLLEFGVVEAESRAGIGRRQVTANVDVSREPSIVSKRSSSRLLPFRPIARVHHRPAHFTAVVNCPLLTTLKY